MTAISREVARISKCAGKSRFETMGLASQVARASLRRNEGVRRHAYRCAECAGFHVGSSIASSKTSVFKRARERLRIEDVDMEFA